MCPFIAFSPNSVIKSADMNSNFTNAVHLTDTQKVQNKINVPALASYSPSASATATLDCSAAAIHSIQMPAGNITIALSNITVNQPIVIRIIQDGVGGRTVSWFSGIKWPGATAPILSTGASKVDVFGILCTAAGTYDGSIIEQNAS